MPGNLPTPDDAPISAETYWTDFGNQNGFGTRLWDKVRQLAIKPGAKSDEPIGLYRASELVQLAVNIGSPDVLISLKECLRHLRAQLASSSHSYPETPWGTYDAYCGHQRSENLSTIGMRLSNWRLQLWKKEHTDNIEFVIDLILSGKPPSTSVSRKVIRDRLKDKKASYWCHLVDYVGNQDPNILCLLPRKATIGPPRWPKNLNSTSYRDLSVRECKLLGEVYADLRPQVLRSADKDLSKDLLYVRDPEGVYRVEDLSYEEIKEHELSSDFFQIPKHYMHSF
ncbi:hypothetical protein BDV29DRAFT_180865 [Aspergillus leporis]|uniref:Uncharacterized protein n=1 Tax=Aspergillus leporis TaxID=41062 RepID=A0A5N5WPP7_9EURO|nr:hypothetical protein BDV29DRAFT_180865 [Aspergillus leporis]